MRFLTLKFLNEIPHNSLFYILSFLNGERKNYLFFHPSFPARRLRFPLPPRISTKKRRSQAANSQPANNRLSIRTASSSSSETTLLTVQPCNHTAALRPAKPILSGSNAPAGFFHVNILPLNLHILHGIQYHVCIFPRHFYKGVLIIHVNASHHFTRHPGFACNGT